MTGFSNDVYSSNMRPYSAAAASYGMSKRPPDAYGEGASVDPASAKAASGKAASGANAAASNNAASASGANSASASGRVTKGLGKTVGNVSLSEEGAAYYKKLKEKFKGMNFVLVSEDMKDQVQANAAAYGSANGMTVLVDVDKIEKMAADKDYREKYEGIIGQASNNLKQLSAGLTANSGSGGNNGVVGFGATINDDGTASYFAVIDKSLAAQSKRIEEKQEAKRAEKKEAAKEAAEARAEERLERKRAGAHGEEHGRGRISDEERHGKDKASDGVGRHKAPALRDEDADEQVKPRNMGKNENLVSVSANSVEELLQKIGDTVQNIRMDSVRTPEEMSLGGSIDFRG